MPVEDKPLLEHSLRLALMHLADAAAGAEQPLMAYRHGGAATASVPRLLDLALWLSLHKQTEYPSEPPHPRCTLRLTEGVSGHALLTSVHAHKLCELVKVWLKPQTSPGLLVLDTAGCQGCQHACA